MKKLKVLSMAAVAAGMVLLTSCLGSSNNEQSGVAYGVVQMLPTSFVNVAYVNDVTPIYSSAFSTLGDNQCVAFAYSINYDAPENKQGNKYLTATVSECIKLDQKRAYSYVDSVIGKTDLSITGIDLSSIVIVKNRIFLGLSHPSVAKDQTNDYILGYDIDNPSVESGTRVYDLYIRGTKTKDGSAVASAGTGLGVFDIEYFLSQATQREKADQKKEIKFRFKYYKEFNKDTTAGVWGNSETLTYPIAEESSSN